VQKGGELFKFFFKNIYFWVLFAISLIWKNWKISGVYTKKKKIKIHNFLKRKKNPKK
jgi:hypothetical protein